MELEVDTNDKKRNLSFSFFIKKYKFRLLKVTFEKSELSISSTFYEQLLHMKVLFAAFSSYISTLANV